MNYEALVTIQHKLKMEMFAADYYMQENWKASESWKYTELIQKPICKCKTSIYNRKSVTEKDMLNPVQTSSMDETN